MLELNKLNFKHLVDKEGIIIIECWAPGCGICVKFDPVFSRIADKNSNHTFARMNVDTEEKLGEFFEISHTPSIMLYRDGLLLLRKPGNFSEKELQKIIDQAESLDMAAVRADLEKSDNSNTKPK
jgi:thioredoxin 1